MLKVKSNMVWVGNFTVYLTLLSSSIVCATHWSITSFFPFISLFFLGDFALTLYFFLSYVFDLPLSPLLLKYSQIVLKVSPLVSLGHLITPVASIIRSCHIHNLPLHSLSLKPPMPLYWLKMKSESYPGQQGPAWSDCFCPQCLLS